jgi:hypothetical protein
MNVLPQCIVFFHIHGSESISVRYTKEQGCKHPNNDLEIATRVIEVSATSLQLDRLVMFYTQ